MTLLVADAHKTNMSLNAMSRINDLQYNYISRES